MNVAHLLRSPSFPSSFFFFAHRSRTAAEPTERPQTRAERQGVRENKVEGESFLHCHQIRHSASRNTSVQGKAGRPVWQRDWITRPWYEHAHRHAFCPDRRGQKHQTRREYLGSSSSCQSVRVSPTQKAEAGHPSFSARSKERGDGQTGRRMDEVPWPAMSCHYHGHPPHAPQKEPFPHTRQSIAAGKHFQGAQYCARLKCYKKTANREKVKTESRRESGPRTQ